MSNRGTNNSTSSRLRRASRRSVLQGLGLGAIGLAGAGSAHASTSRAIGAEQQAQMAEPEIGSDPSILVFSATAGYRHGAIPTGNQTIQELASEIGDENDVEFTVDVISEDASQFPSDVSELEGYDVVVWNSTTGDVLNDDQQAAFEAYLRGGGGYMGIHAAADTEYEWEFYGDMLGGAYFEGHPSQQDAEVHVTDQTHPSTNHLPATWDRFDEWYNYQENPRGDVHVLATLDESTYNEEDGEPGTDDHPIAWCRYYQGARSWYTGMGHTEASYEDENFRQHLKGGLMWSAGYVDGGASGTVWDSYEKVPLDTDTEAPVMLDVAPDGRVFYIEHAPFGGGPESTAEVNVIDQSGPEPETTVALELTVYAGQEDGLLGILLDSDFENTGWVYLFYSPPNAEIDEPHNRLSRFTVDGNTIDPESEVEIMRVPTQREECCHTGGDMHWSPDGEMLYLTTGDDTNPFDSSGYAPIDESKEEPYWDAQRTAASTNDLRGKILRIIPNEDGSYDIPEDNLFAGDSSDQTKPEIYTMGNRNPYRAAVDQETGTLYWGDYGPDAGSWDANRGPPGIVEFNRATEAGFYGWPYFVGPSIPYVDYDFGTGESSGPFDPDNPTNDSPNNTGLTDLPPSQEAMIYYPYSWSALLDSPPEYAQPYLPDEPPWPQLTGGAPMAGPVFRSSDDHESDVGLPSSFDGKFFIMEWGAGWIKYVSFDENNNVMEIDPFLPDTEFLHPMDMKVGPDGSLYLVEWGSGAFAATNDDSGIYRINHDATRTPAPIFDTGQVSVGVGQTATVEATLNNTTSAALESGEVTLTAPDGSNIEIGGASGTTFDSLAAGESQSMSWEVTVPDSAASGTYTLTATASYTHDGEQEEESSTVSLQVEADATVTTPFGYDAGGAEIDGTVTIDGVEFVDSSPAVTATGDASASGNGVDVAANSLTDPISGTENDALFQSEQYGGNLSYEVDIANGTYDVTLYFAEFYFGGNGNGGGEGSRVFDVSVEGQQVFEGLDIFAEVGHDAALTETVEDVEVTDGTLNITTTTQADNSKFAGFLISASNPLQNGLAAHLPLDDDTPTNEVTGTDATINGDVTTGAEGVVGNAYELHTNGSIDTSADSVVTEPLAINGEGATVGTWMNFTDHEAYGRAFQVGGTPDGAPTDGWDIEFSNEDNTLTVQLWNDGGTGAGDGGSAIAVDPETWYFVVGVVTGGDIRLHVFDQDGELDSSPQTWTGGSRTQSDAAPLIVGSGDGRDTAGRFDEVWAYSRALSEGQVGQLYTRSLEGDGGGPEPTTIELGGQTTGWVGQAPSSIEGETNPTLEMTAGEEYTVTWENLDGNLHDFHILDSQGNEIEGTGAPPEGYLSEIGATASVTFTATEEMAEYYCSVHPRTMRGDVSVDGGGGGGLSPVVGDSPPTDPNGDGRYEDVNGDGEVNYADVVDLFEQFDSAAVRDNPEAFDFNGNGRLDFDDIVALFNSL